MLNKVFLMGRLVADPELKRYLAANSAVPRQATMVTKSVSRSAEERKAPT